MADKATTAIFIDKYHPQKDSTCAVSIRVTFQRKKKYYPTIYNFTEDEFKAVLTASKPTNKQKEARLKLNALETKAVNIIKDLPFFTWAAFEKHYLQNRGYSNKLETAFNDTIKQFKDEGRIGTSVAYECAKNSLIDFKAGAEFSDITPAFLNKYERWMLDKSNSVTTVSIYLRSLRAIFNRAINDGLISKELYPFGKRKYEIPTGNNIKKALTLADIAKIFNYQAHPNSTTAMAKDYWMFMYYCNGMNVKDMCLLKYKNLQKDVIVFDRAKTARTKRVVESIRVPLLEDVQDIINRRGNKKKEAETFVFPVLRKGLTPERERQLIQQLTHLINDHLKVIAKDVEIENDVTTYAARHSFATVLKRSGASTEFISEALGHSNLKTTQNYLASFEDDSKKEMAKALTAFKK